MAWMVGRREFLGRMAMLSGAALATPLDAVAGDARPRRVVIVGAGLAGLCTAWELERRGVECVVLEADRHHVGGRVRTHEFGGGLRGELGAMRIPKVHARVRDYCRRFGLRLRPFVHDDVFVYGRGRYVRAADVGDLRDAYALPTDAGKPGDLWTRAVGNVLRDMTPAERRDLHALVPMTPSVRTLDQLSLQQLAERAGLSPDAIEYMATGMGVETLLPSGATEHLREEMDEVWSSGFDEIVGGTQRLPEAFEGRLRRTPRTGCQVIRLEQGEDGGRPWAAAVFLEDGVERAERGDAVVCTVPYPVLTQIDARPAFSGAKRRAIRELGYDSSTKVLVVTRRRFWEEDDHIYGGCTQTDLPTGTTVYPSDNARRRDPDVSRGAGVLLASYTWGQAARRMAMLPREECRRVVLDAVGRIHPQLREPGMVEDLVSWSWDEHRWSQGAFAWFLPGQFTALHADVLRPEGRIWFAGEHASLSHTWMEGALESAQRVAAEVLASAQRAA
jgi:monoamine oxidase